MQCANRGGFVLKPSYLKPHLSYQDQYKLLIARNLIVTNETFCIKKLRHINYYRLSAYFLPFYEKNNSFKEGVNFEEILQLYYFDKEFRNLMFYAIEKIEVYMRTQVAHVISQKRGAFGYRDEEIMHDTKKHQEIINTIKSETKRSKEVFVKEYFGKYDEEFLPVWSMVEIISFNTLSKIFSNLKESYRKEILQEIDIKPFVFENWLHVLTYVRNISAHHSRLWNKMLAIEPKKPKNQKSFDTLNSKKIYFVIRMILFILEKIDEQEFNLRNEIIALLKKYPKVDLVAMGFPNEWKERELCR